MCPPLKPEDEIKEAEGDSPELRDTEQVLAGLEGVERASAELPQNGPPEPVPSPTKTPRLAKRVAVLAVIALLAGLAYVERANLTKIFLPPATDASRQVATGERKILYWVDPMHPTYKSDKPGKAPDCGMDLVPVYADGEQVLTSLPDGAFKISPQKQQLIGVTYGVATYQVVSRTMRTVGRLAYDETRINHVHTKIEGWIEEVFIDFTGKLVEKGQPLLTVYSPDLLQTQQEYLLAMRGRTELGKSPFKEASMGANSLYESAKRRLELWDVSQAEIKELERTGKPTKAVTVYAPATGFVLTRNAFTKQRVMPDTDLYSIADLSNVWVLADIYEYEAADISVGQSAIVTLPYLPGRTFRGQVTYIYPQVESTTRTLKARIEVANPKFELKPDMYANVELKIDYGKHVVVPQEAVMDSGAEQTVFVALDGGYFAPRKVQLGAKVDNKFIVLAGLKPGERIVTSGNFLIDSESKLKSAAGAMGMPGMDHGSSKATTNEKPASTVDHSQHQPGPPPDPQSKKEGRLKHQRRGASVDDSQSRSRSRDNSGIRRLDVSTDHTQHQTNSKQKILYWYSVMHPQYRSDKPAKCPECGMDMVPKYADEE
jgi:RND family efflux transporter MFP subunit